MESLTDEEERYMVAQRRRIFDFASPCGDGWVSHYDEVRDDISYGYTYPFEEFVSEMLSNPAILKEVIQ